MRVSPKILLLTDYSMSVWKRVFCNLFQSHPHPDPPLEGEGMLHLHPNPRRKPRIIKRPMPVYVMRQVAAEVSINGLQFMVNQSW